ncbi:LLM class flavin-dependent oxidoreductase [Alcaligenes nematophilus]|uniref:LLM class flavin-dependent oxidoreductase n=1 Tax=Alcaligenes nematophilus TaxID=2994643 RepID=UPI0024611319|nr:LLM class flavin-dependent oxidoreductase [Alcaligenes nematophilus]MDH4865431.1 LLM class flavin-dependent oxidoreductase [Bacillus cereus]MDY7126730.1 LLM class flavin-dependent oxidoreductase [Alcaligenes nematophilus]
MNDSVFGTRRGTAPVPLSILDFAMAGKGVSASEALAGSIELARLVDRRGFTRYWVAEHHSMPGVTTSSPAMLLARLVGETHRIRLGAGGMMLPNFPPLVVAEQFGVLASFAPGRIDLGIGRAPGTDLNTAAALRRGQISAEDFPAQFQELLQFLDGDFPDGHPYQTGEVYAVPGPIQDQENGIARSFKRPPVWLLGSSDYSARLAAKLGFPFAFAAHLADQNVLIALEVYRENFRPSAVLDRPYVIASFGVMAADDEAEARRQAWAYSHAMMRMTTRRSFVVPTPPEAELYEYSSTEQRIMQMWNAKIMSGTGDQVADKLNAWQQRVQADELMILNLGHSQQAIYRSTELIADAYDMPSNVLDEDDA